MNDFERIFDGLEYLGPGAEHYTLQALAQVSSSPERILDIGCGAGRSALTLAAHTKAQNCWGG